MNGVLVIHIQLRFSKAVPIMSIEMFHFIPICNEYSISLPSYFFSFWRGVVSFLSLVLIG